MKCTKLFEHLTGASDLNAYIKLCENFVEEERIIKDEWSNNFYYAIIKFKGYCDIEVNGITFCDVKKIVYFFNLDVFRIGLEGDETGFCDGCASINLNKIKDFKLYF